MYIDFIIISYLINYVLVYSALYIKRSKLTLLSHAEPLLSDAETPEKPLIQVILRSLSSSVFQASNKFATNLSENRVSDLI